MKFQEKSRYLFAFKAVLLGLLTTQIIATVQVYLSNRALQQSMQMVQQAGYLAVPNENVWQSLQGVGAAFWGGLLFTLSIGTGLSIVALFSAWTWDRFLGRRKAGLFIYLLLWFMGIGAVNVNGLSLPATAYVVIVPLLAFPAALFWLPTRQDQGGRLQRIAYLGVPFLLILVFLPVAKKSIYVDIRDTVLLGNSIGRKINEFYYDYTLHAAQAFKSLEQKTIRTARLHLTANESHRPAIEDMFLAHDYLVIAEDGAVDLEVVEQGKNLRFMHHGKTIFAVTLRDFGANPTLFLEEFSMKTDRHNPLRLLAFISMVIGAPLSLYIILHGVFFILVAIFTPPRRAALCASILCLLCGLAIALPLYRIQEQSVNKANVQQMLQSDRWQDRVAGLRFMAEHEQPNDRVLLDSMNILKSEKVPERYWFVRALGNSRSPEAGKVLLSALDDPSINVVCMAFFGLGQQGNKSAVEAIQKRIMQSTHWYEQWYAYRALRSLGWKQEKR